KPVLHWLPTPPEAHEVSPPLAPDPSRGPRSQSSTGSRPLPRPTKPVRRQLAIPSRAPGAPPTRAARSPSPSRLPAHALDHRVGVLARGKAPALDDPQRARPHGPLGVDLRREGAAARLVDVHVD